MNPYVLIPLISFAAYAVLLFIVLRQPRTRILTLFSYYLVVSSIWSLSTAILFSEVTDWPRLWMSIAGLSGPCMMVAYFHFVCAFVHRGGCGKAVAVGYGAVALILVPLAAMRIIPVDVSIAGARLDVDWGVGIYLLGAVGFPFFILSIAFLLHRYRALKDPLSRNRILYLLAGVALVGAFGIRDLVLPLPKYPLDHIGHLVNAFLIAYAIMRYRLLDIKLVVRKGLVYSSISVLITAFYLLVLFGLHRWIGNWASSAGLAAILAVTILMAGLFNPLRSFAQRAVDRAFYGKRYDHRQMALNFARSMSNVIDLEELAEAMVRPIAKAVNATQVSLLLPQNGCLTSVFAERLVDGEPVIPIKLSQESPIVSWLIREHKPLSRETLDVDPAFKGLWEVERDTIEAVELELLFPIQSRGSLIGILALSRKASGRFYSSDDVDLLMNVVTQAAVAIENAQLYAEAKERANMEELTGLYNHRYFHERLDEEISRCSRFGEVFSLLYVGLDLFKPYNDVYGHHAGDEVLAQIGRCITGSIRGIDMAFRYGGDEFTAILPQASVDDVRKVGERIRKRTESEMDSAGIAVTCSIGAASWPTDGVMKEELIGAAFAALKYCKEAGRNRVSIASDIAPARMPRITVRGEGEPGVLSTIYALAATVDAKDHYTYGHSKKVSKYATAIAEALGHPEEELATVRAAALLHDIGKIGVSDTVLVKKARLNDEDWESIHEHPKLGAAILKHVGQLRECLPAILYHHERYDGDGYPAGLRGENIPLDARILAVADAFDAMISFRPYREGRLTVEEALEELNRCAGTQFDPAIVRVCSELHAAGAFAETRSGRNRRPAANE